MRAFFFLTLCCKLLIAEMHWIKCNMIMSYVSHAAAYISILRRWETLPDQQRPPLGSMTLCFVCV